MKKSLIISLIIIFFLLVVMGLIIFLKNKNNQYINGNNEVFSEEVEGMEDIKLFINNKKYAVKLEENETVKKLISLLPLEFNMEELNGNEKYVYMDYTLPTNAFNPKHIEAGDIMLYGNNCLVVFYKSFDTSYSYTKIGHIDNLEDLGKDAIIFKLEK